MGGKWTPEAKRKNKERLARLKAQKEQEEIERLAFPEPEPGDIQEQEEAGADVSINIPSPDPEPEPTMAQRILGKIGITTSKPHVSKKSAELNVELLASLVPAACLFLAGMSELFIRNQKYKPCVPRQAELEKIIRPIVNIISRRVEIAGKMTEDTLDLLTALAMTVVLGTRMYSTYLVIRDSDQGETDASSNITNFPTSQQRERTHEYRVASSRAVAGANGRGESLVSHDRAVSGDGVTVLDGQRANDIISHALEQDMLYRAYQGIL